MKKWLVILFLFIFGNPNKFCYCQQNIDSLEIELLAETNKEKKVDLLLTLFDELKISDEQKSSEYAHQAFELSVSYGYELGHLRSLNALAEVYIYKTDFSAAMDFAVMAKAMAEKYDNKLQLGHAIFYIAKTYSSLGNYEKSSELYYQILRLNEQIQDSVLEVKVLNGIGLIHHNQNNYDKALEYYHKALLFAKQINYPRGISKSMNNVAAIYGTKEEYNKAEQYLRESIEYNKIRNDNHMLGINFLNLGYYFQVLKQYDSALHYFNKSLDIYTTLHYDSYIIRTNIFLAEYFLEMNDMDKCKLYAEESFEASQIIGQKRYVYETAALLSQIYFHEKDSVRAYQYQNLELRMKDSLNIEENQTEITKLELQYKLENETQKKRIEQQRKDLIRIIIIISLLFIIVLIILLLGRMRIKARSVKLEKVKLEMELEIRNKELTVHVMSIMKKNETLSKIANKLKGIQREAYRDETKLAIRKLSRELNKAVEDEPWQEFEMRFKQVHNEFYDKLNNKFPNLSPQEQRLCAFLRLNMTTKEISEMTGQRTTSIDMARTRLRKKLGITNTQTNLISFLSQI